MTLSFEEAFKTNMINLWKISREILTPDLTLAFNPTISLKEKVLKYLNLIEK